MVNILASCTHYFIDLEKVEPRLEEDLRKTYDLTAEDDCLNINGIAVDEYRDKYGYDCFRNGINYNSVWFDKTELRDILDKYLENNYHYLVMAVGCTWNGGSGFKFCDDVVETVERDYDINLILEKTIGDKKAIVCKESSHDVPMGARTYIISLTNEEYDKLSDDSTTFDEIEAFVKQTCEGE